MKNRSLIITTAVMIIVLAAALIVYPSLSEKATENMSTENNSSEASQYDKYKDVSVYDKTGNKVMLSDFEGKPIILNFWATWCGYCIQEMPDFEEAYKEYGDEIQFLIVNTSDGITKGENFIISKGYTFPTYYDLERNAAITYSISGIPRTIAIDKDGNIRYNRAGMISAENLESIIEMIK